MARKKGDGCHLKMTKLITFFINLKTILVVPFDEFSHPIITSEQNTAITL
jgi:hypothetical protein